MKVLGLDGRGQQEVGLPLWLMQRMLCLLWTSHSRTVSSWDPDRRSVPSMDTDRQVTRFLRDQEVININTPPFPLPETQLVFSQRPAVQV